VSLVKNPKVTSWSLVALIAVASVANLNLAVANIAIPDIGITFKAGQTSLNLVSVGFSLGLAGTVLYLGAIGDRYGRKGILLLGMALTIPTSLLATWSPDVGVLIVARILGGVAAGMAYPTTLALITALFDGQKRTRAIALWSAIGGAMIAVAILLAGWLLTFAWWGSVFFVTAPLAAIVMVLAWFTVPAHVKETTEPVDNFGGILSVIGILALVLAINFAPTPGDGTIALVAGAVALVALLFFFYQQHRAKNPLFDLAYARRRTFWVAATAGLIIFGTLMGAFYIGTQFLQQVLGYSTLKAGTVGLPAAFVMVFVAPMSAKFIARFGSRATLLTGYVFLFFSFMTMLFLWTETSGFGVVVLAFALMGAGVGLAGAPASHSLTSSVPVFKVGMASGTADLQRDLGGSIVQSILGAILTAAYASDVARQLVGTSVQNNAQVTTILERSYGSAAAFAKTTDPKTQQAIIEGAKQSFLHGANYAYATGALFIVVGGIIVFFLFPKKQKELDLMAEFERVDAAAAQTQERH